MMLIVVDEYINCIAIPNEVNVIIGEPWSIADTMNLWSRYGFIYFNIKLNFYTKVKYRNELSQLKYVVYEVLLKGKYD